VQVRRNFQQSEIKDKTRGELGKRMERRHSTNLVNLMKAIAAILAILGLELASWQHNLSAQEMAGGSSAGQGVTLKWLGVAGWEIQFGQTVILIDPFLTRGQANPTAEWKTDEGAVLSVINRADYIFAGHSQADHIADIPFIAVF
jgi:hypothetical protein